jgi:hypothetical protein
MSDNKKQVKKENKPAKKAVKEPAKKAVTVSEEQVYIAELEQLLANQSVTIARLTTKLKIIQK